MMVMPYCNNYQVSASNTNQSTCAQPEAQDYCPPEDGRDEYVVGQAVDTFYSQAEVLRAFAEQQKNKGSAYKVAPKNLEPFLQPAQASGNYDAAQALKIATDLKGRRSDGLQTSSQLRGFYKDPTLRSDPKKRNDVNCANFVSALLEKSGGLKKGTGSCNVAELELAMLQQGWHRVKDGQLPKPGDVWIGDDRAHVEMVSKVQGDKVKLVGSNNIDSKHKKPDNVSALEESGQWVTEHDKKDIPGFYLTRN